MTAPSLLDELEGVVRLSNEADRLPYGEGKAYAYRDATVRALNFVLDYHATLADMAKRLEAAERDGRRLDWLESVGFATRNMSRVERPANVHCWAQDDGKWMWTAHFVGSEFTSARDAIDAATQEGEG